MKKKQEPKPVPEEEIELTQEEMDAVTGGANPFADNKRVSLHDYDSNIKDKI